jgi:beta-glucosidase
VWRSWSYSALALPTRQIPPAAHSSAQSSPEDNGWEIWPDGLRAVLTRVHHDYGPPELAITENGATYPDAVAPDGSVSDIERRHYLERHIGALADARDEGIPVNAYFVWSLLDNFEWGEGYGHPLGIVHVDFATQRGTVKASGDWYRALLKDHGGLTRIASTRTTRSLRDHPHHGAYCQGTRQKADLRRDLTRSTGIQ